MPANATPRKLSKFIPPLQEQGMDYLAAAAAAGVSIQAKQVTQSGASPFSVVLEDAGMKNMEDDEYVVIVQGETAARVTVDQSSLTKVGFDILGGADTEVLHVLVVGRLSGQAA